MGEGRRANPWKGLLAGCYTDLSPNAPHRLRRTEASRPPFPDSNAPHGSFSAKANSMDIDDKRDVNEESRARRLTLVRGEAREVTLYQAPKLELVVNVERKLFEAVMANDPRRVSTWLARGADANARDRDGRTPLFEAMLPWKDPAIAELLFARGADVGARDK